MNRDEYRALESVSWHERTPCARTRARWSAIALPAPARSCATRCARRWTEVR